MATFLSLPNELILFIIELAEPDDLENLSTICKRIRNLASKTMQQHREDKRSFSEITPLLFKTSITHPALQVALKAYDVMHELAGDQRLRLYPKHVCMDNDAYAIAELLSEGDSVGLKAAMEEDGTYRTRVLNSFENPYIRPDEMETWRARVAKGDLQAVNCLLLTLLPNVERIVIKDYRVSSMMSDMIERIAKRNACAPGTMLSLTKLSEVSIHALSDLGRPALSSEITQAFLSLPSVRVLRCTRIRADFPIPQSSNLTELSLRQCAIAVTDLSQLFTHLIGVKKFAYTHQSDLEDRSGANDYSCDTFIATLASHAKDTLQELEYSTSGQSTIQHSDRPEYTSGLRRFKILEKIRITCAFFVSDHNPETCVVQRVQRLVELLPSSIKNLTLIGSITAGDSLGSQGGLEKGEQTMFAGVAELKDERFPHLEEVIFQNSDWKRAVEEQHGGEVFRCCGYNILVDEETRFACEKVGIAMRAVPCLEPPAREITETLPGRNAAETQTIAAS